MTLTIGVSHSRLTKAIMAPMEAKNNLCKAQHLYRVHQAAAVHWGLGSTFRSVPQVCYNNPRRGGVAVPSATNIRPEVTMATTWASIPGQDGQTFVPK